MSEIGAEPAPRFAVGRVIAQSLAVFLRHPSVFVGIGILFAIPDIAFTNWHDRWMAEAKDDPLGFGSMWIFFGLVSLFLAASSAVTILTFALTQASLTIGLFEDLRARRVTFFRCLRECVPASAQLLALSLILGAAAGLATLLVMLVATFLWTPMIYVLAVLGVVAVLALCVLWWVIVPAMVIEGYGALASFQRSLDLTRGNRWRIAAVFFLPVLPAMACAALLALILDETGLAFAIADYTIDVAYTIASAMLAAVGYTHLRAEKEGFSVHDVAAVFD